MPITQRATATVALATRTNTAVTPPAGTTAGDLLVVDIAVGGTGAAATITPPAGWTQIATVAYGDSSDNYYLRMSRFVKPFVAGETTYTFTHVSKSSQAFTRALVGADTSAPNDGTAFTLNQDNIGGTSISGSMTTVTNGAWVLVFRGSWDGNAITPPAGFTESLDVQVIWEGYQEKATAGATGTITVPAGNNGTAPSGLIISAIKPAGATIPKGGFAAAYGFGAAVASGKSFRRGTFAASYGFGPAAASGDIVAEGSFGGTYGFGVATARGKAAAEGGFVTDAYTFGPPAATGESPVKGAFAGAWSYGPAAFEGPPVGATGDFSGTYAYGPATMRGQAGSGGDFVGGGFAFGSPAFGGESPSKGAFSTSVTHGIPTARGVRSSRGAGVTAFMFGPAASSGESPTEGGFAGTYTFGPGSSSGPIVEFTWPTHLDLEVHAPVATLEVIAPSVTLSVQAPVLTLEVIS